MSALCQADDGWDCTSGDAAPIAAVATTAAARKGPNAFIMVRIVLYTIAPPGKEKEQRMTELEGAVLGVIWSRGPLTAYGVRQRFQESPTAAWSASKGAIYPAIERLIAAGLLKCLGEKTGRRSARSLSLTPAGEQALRLWISGLPGWMGGATVDPIRTRVNYLGALGPAERRIFLDKVEENAKAALADIASREIDPKHKHPWALEAALIGAALEVEARLKWLDEIRNLLPGK